MSSIETSLAGLPLGQRRVVIALIAETEALTYRQVADLLEIQVGTVYTHLRRIRLASTAVSRPNARSSGATCGPTQPRTGTSSQSQPALGTVARSQADSSTNWAMAG